MRGWLLVCALALSCSLAQPGDWRRQMAQAAAFERAGRYEEAAAGYRSVLHLVEQSSPGDARLPNILNALASASIGLGDFAAAESHYRRAMSLVEASASKENADYSLLLENLANLFSEEGQAKAETMLREGLDIDSRVFGAKQVRTATVGNSLSQVLLARGNYVEAETLLLDAIPLLEGQPPPCADCLLTALNNLGMLRFHQGRLQEAAGLFERSLAGFEAALGPVHVEPREIVFTSGATESNNLALKGAAENRG